MDWLKDEFRNMLMSTTHTYPISESDFDKDTLIIIDPNSSNRSSCVTESSAADFRNAQFEDEFHNLLITPNSSTPWSCVTESSADFKIAHESTDLQYEYEDEVSHSSTSYQSINSIHEIGPIPLEVMYDLHSIAKRMITAGYLHECIQVYMSVRKPVVAAIFCHLWINKFDIGDVQRLKWDVLEPKIRRSIQAAKVCIRFLLAVEKQLYGQIFQDYACFITGVANWPLNFSEDISINPQTPEKHFKKLHLFDNLSKLLSDMDILFGWHLLEQPVRDQVAVLLLSLFKTAKETLLEFDDDLNTPVPGGRIHPLTRFGMNYILLISDYMKLLFGSNLSAGSHIIYSNPKPPDLNFPEQQRQWSLFLHQRSIIRFLEIQLAHKSNYYKDDSLSHIFLMNNIHYIVQKVRGSPELCDNIGDNLGALTRQFRREKKSYERLTWNSTIDCLRYDGVVERGSSPPQISKSALKQLFKDVNSIFEEVHRVQETWSVPDPQLREEIRISISEKLIPTYRSFLGQCKVHIERGKHPEKYIKYSVKDLEIAVLDFFEGRTVSHHTANRSQGRN